MMGGHITQLTEQTRATEALLNGLGGAEAEWAKRHEAARAERAVERNACLAAMDVERQEAFDSVDKAAEKQIREFNPLTDSK
jgi:hypothetical protein